MPTVTTQVAALAGITVMFLAGPSAALAYGRSPRMDQQEISITKTTDQSTPNLK